MQVPGNAGTMMVDLRNFVFGNGNFAGTPVVAYADPPPTPANFSGGAACPTPP